MPTKNPNNYFSVNVILSSPFSSGVPKNQHSSVHLWLPVDVHEHTGGFPGLWYCTTLTDPVVYYVKKVWIKFYRKAERNLKHTRSF